MIRKKKGTLKEETPGQEKEHEALLDTKSVEAPPGASLETPPEADTFSHAQVDFPVVGIGASAGGAGGVRSLLFRHARRRRSRHGLCPGPASGPGPQEHLDRPDPALHPYAGLRGRGWDDGPAQLRLHHPPQPGHGLSEQCPPTAGAPRGQRLPIDSFFRSLALDQRERTICIVLSGTGSDGTLGVRAIKGEGAW
jgi:two-component system CheB/CheR fusion protein